MLAREGVVVGVVGVVVLVVEHHGGGDKVHYVGDGGVECTTIVVVLCRVVV